MYRNLFKYLYPILFIIIFIMSPLAVQPVAGQDFLPSLGDARSGTDGFQFIKIMVDPRSAALSGSNAADAMDGSSLYWNPALASQAPKNEFMGSHTAYFADISMEYFSYIHHFDWITIGGSVQFLNSGSIEETTEFEPLGTGRTFRTNHISAGITASQKLTESFSYGLTLRYITERIEELKNSTGAIDFGFFYSVGETGARFSVGVSNFGIDATPSGTTERQTLDGIVTEENFEDVTVPTRFNLALAYDIIDGEQNKFMITTQVTNVSDNSELLSLGGEYSFLDQFFIRTGFQLGRDELNLPSVGAGVKLPVSERIFNFDYSYTTFDRLDSIHRVALRLSF